MQAGPAAFRLKEPSALPGFGLSLGYTLTYLGLIVLLPLAALVYRAAGIGLSGFADVLGDTRVVAALRTSFGIAFAAALVA